MCIDNGIITKYNSLRPKHKRDYLCFAPFTNMYFNVHGGVAPCWLGYAHTEDILKKNIKEIWVGDKFETFRQNIYNLKLDKTCATCKNNILAGNHYSVLSRAYDLNSQPQEYPTMMELELDNTCNFECIMCNQYLSSSIAERSGHKIKSEIIYDRNFVDQLEEFIPHLHEIRFNGGEPFLINIYYEIWERIIRINPGLKIVVATNGSVYNNKIEGILRRGNFHFNISIDSLNKDQYSKIRKNGNLENTMNNFYRFLKYTKKNRSTLCILTNPMRNNWEEMPDFVKFCNHYNIPLWFNTIIHPKELSLWALPFEELSIIYNRLSKYHFAPNIFKPQSLHNIKAFRNLTNIQVFNWMLESKNKFRKDNTINTFEDIKKYISENTKNNDVIQKISFIENELVSRAIDNNLFFNLINNYSIEEFIEYLKTVKQEDIFDSMKNYL